MNEATSEDEADPILMFMSNFGRTIAKAPEKRKASVLDEG